jgi:hypothetical protein
VGAASSIPLQRLCTDLKTSGTAVPNILLDAAAVRRRGDDARHRPIRSPTLPNDDPLSTASSAAGITRIAGWSTTTPLLLPAAAAAAALAASWRCWIDPLVDSGREMDVPWRLAQGERLYRDVTYYYGPLGPWVNALALDLAGNRWLVLELICAALSALLFLFLYRLTRRAGSPLSATVATALAAALCLGAPRGGAFIFPYSSASLFALAGGLLALEAATAAPRRPVWGALGVAIALASRVEVGAAVALVLVLAGLRSPSREERRADLAAAAAGGLLAGAAYGVAFAGLSWRELCADGPLGPLLAMPQEWQVLYLKVAGLGEPGRAASHLAVSLLLDALLLAAAAWFALPRPGRPARRSLFAVAGLLLFAVHVGSGWSPIVNNLPPALEILPLVAALAAIVALARLRRPLAGPDRPRFLLFSLSALLAARVLCGLAVGPRMSAYAALPLPGLVATAAVLVFDLLAPRLPDSRIFTQRMAAVFAFAGLLFLYQIARLDHRPGMVELETAAGSLRLPAGEAAAIARTLGYLEGRARQGETLTAFPESGFFNFVLGLRSPLRQDLIVPGVLPGPREAAAARQVDTAGPKYILLCNRPTPEYGPVSFGRDYAALLWSEVLNRYVLAGAFGWPLPTAPVGASRFFIRLYERSPAATAPVVLPSPGPRRRTG